MTAQKNLLLEFLGYRGDTGVLQKYYTGVTMCFRGVKCVFNVFYRLYKCSMGVRGILMMCYRFVTGVLQRCYKGFTICFRGFI